LGVNDLPESQFSIVNSFGTIVVKSTKSKGKKPDIRVVRAFDILMYHLHDEQQIYKNS